MLFWTVNIQWSRSPADVSRLFASMSAIFMSRLQVFWYDIWWSSHRRHCWLSSVNMIKEKEGPLCSWPRPAKRCRGCVWGSECENCSAPSAYSASSVCCPGQSSDKLLVFVEPRCVKLSKYQCHVVDVDCWQHSYGPGRWRLSVWCWWSAQTLSRRWSVWVANAYVLAHHV